jgi:hypothetical protein
MADPAAKSSPGGEPKPRASPFLLGTQRSSQGSVIAGAGEPAPQKRPGLLGASRGSAAGAADNAASGGRPSSPGAPARAESAEDSTPGAPPSPSSSLSRDSKRGAGVINATSLNQLAKSASASAVDIEAASPPRVPIAV